GNNFDTTFSEMPFAVTDQVIVLSPHSFGARTRKIRGLRFVKKYRGSPRGGPSGVTELSGPGGISSSCSVLRLRYPKTKSNDSSGFLIQPSRYGTTLRPVANLMSGINGGG